MANGRCRLHGGLSTGPKTAEGIERIRKAVTKHGFYSKAIQEERQKARALVNQMRSTIASLHGQQEPNPSMSPPVADQEAGVTDQVLDEIELEQFEELTFGPDELVEVLDPDHDLLGLFPEGLWTFPSSSVSHKVKSRPPAERK